MKTVNQIIAAAGSDEKTQAACAVSREALKKWRQFGFIPPKHWDTIVELTGGKVRYRDLSELRRAAK